VTDGFRVKGGAVGGPRAGRSRMQNPSATKPEDGRAALVDITNAGRALLDDRRRDRRDRLAELLMALAPEDEATLTLAAHVALPIIRRLVHNATNPARSQTAKTA
jgi:hypothetical protein